MASEQATRELRNVLVPIGVISAVVNLLMLTLPIYMLQIYDRVLTSRNVTTLIMLTVLAVAFVGLGSYLNHVRSRIAERLAIRFEQRLGPTVFAAELNSPQAQGSAGGDSLVGNLDQVRQYISGTSGAGLTALFDIPWVPIFILLLAILHPVLGLTALLAALALLVVGFFSAWSSRSQISDGAAATGDAGRFFAAALRQRDVILAMNMDTTIGQRWHRDRVKGLGQLVEGSDITSGFKALSAFVRQLAQMSMLGLGAYLAIYDLITPGVIVAGSIICGRALGPLDQAQKTVKNGIKALHAFRSLREDTKDVKDRSVLTPLPKPFGTLEVEDVGVMFKDQAKPALSKISFRLEPNGSLGIVGPAGSGKSVLGRILVGALSPSTGRVSLGGYDFYREHDGRIGEHIGYVAQRLTLIEGTVLENITRFRSGALSDAVRAASRVGAHPVIEKLPQGYNTPVRDAAKHLTPSQLRMIEFARAACNDPTLIVLDKVEIGLDAPATQALRRLINWGRRDERILIMASDRPSFVRDFDNLLVLWNGTMEGVIKPEKLLDVMQQPKQITSA